MKILIISHNPISTYQSMGKTFLSLFDCFKKEELCQLYIYPSIPDVEKCESYYRVTDKEVLKSCFGKRKIGREIKTQEILTATKTVFVNDRDEVLYRNRKNKKPLRMLLRDDLWVFSHWYNKNLKLWLQKEQPTCIFVAPGTGKFLYNIAIKISKKLNLPIVTYICDDYYFTKKNEGILAKYKDRLLKKKIEQLMGVSKQVIVISKEIEQIYSKKFNVQSETIMTGSNYPIELKPVVKNIVKSITYMGNIRCNRFRSLADIGAALDEINKNSGSSYELNIYTGEKDKNILDNLTKYTSINLKGFVSGKEFYDVFRSADMLLHVEAFDEKSIDLVKHSVSTKIADSLGSGICLFAYGPSCVSSMKHLIENDSAVCAVSKDELKQKLLLAFNDELLRNKKIFNALKTAHNFHDSVKTSSKFYLMMEKLNESSSS